MSFLEKALKRKETITVTLRIDKDIMNKLALDADNDAISLNSLVNHVLKRYVEWNKFEDKSSMIPINSVVLKELIHNSVHLIFFFYSYHDKKKNYFDD